MEPSFTSNWTDGFNGSLINSIYLSSVCLGGSISASAIRELDIGLNRSESFGAMMMFPAHSGQTSRCQPHWNVDWSPAPL